MEKPVRSYVAHLDGLRGGAALWVLVAHCIIWAGCYTVHLPNPKIAVDIFMVISGYLMAHNWPVLIEAPRRAVYRFWLRRFFRIAPAYYLSLALAAVLAPWFLGGYAVLHRGEFWRSDAVYDPHLVHFTVENLLMHLSFLFGLVPRWSFSTMLPDWSIGLEMQFYAVFPALIGLVREKGIVWSVIPLLLLSVVGSLLAAGLDPIRPGAPPGYPEPSLLLLKLPLFLVGILAAEAVRSYPTERGRAVVLSVATLLLSTFFAQPPVSAVAGLLLYLGIVPTAPLARSLGRFLAAPLAHFLAEMSYCVYLFHGFFIAFAGGYLFRQAWFLALSPPWHAVILAGIVIPLTYAFAALANKAVEQPGIRLGRSLLAMADRHKQSDAAVAVA